MTLREVAIFRGLSEDALTRLEGECTWRTVRAKENIVHFQDQTRDVFILIEGRARVIIYSVTGRVVIFRDLGPGDMFGEFAPIDEKQRSASVEALETCRVACLAGAEFKKLLRHEPVVVRALLDHAVGQIRALTARVFEFSTLAVNNRIHAELLRLAQGATIDGRQARVSPFPTHLDIASRISTHREAVTRELNRLVKLGLIKREGGALVIKDMQRLARMVHDAVGD
jgi:CRP/FNR family transcriptional regulator, cyclic AMP receptor protein